MKKKLLSLLAVGALLAQSSGVYAMGQRARDVWGGTKAAAQQDVVAPMGKVASAVSEDQRFQAVSNFLIAAGNKAKEGPQALYQWLQEHKKIATGIVLAIIVVILSFLYQAYKKRSVTLDGILEDYQIPRSGPVYNFLLSISETDVVGIEAFFDYVKDILSKNVPEIALLNDAERLTHASLAEPDEKKLKKLALQIIGFAKAKRKKEGYDILKDWVRSINLLLGRGAGFSMRID